MSWTNIIQQQYMTRADGEVLREAIKDDLNSGLNRILDEMINLQHAGTPAPTLREITKRKRISTNPVRRDDARKTRLVSPPSPHEAYVLTGDIETSSEPPQ